MTDYDKFMDKIEIDEKLGCWNWIGAIDYRSHGVIVINKKPSDAQIFSFEYFIGEIPENHVICHTCKSNGDNPKCVNPEHMYLASKEDKLKSLEETKKPISKAKIKIVTDMFCGFRYFTITQIAKEVGLTPRDVKKITKNMVQGEYKPL